MNSKNLNIVMTKENGKRKEISGFAISNLVIMEIEGFETMTFDRQISQNVFIDDTYLIGSKPEPRKMTITCFGNVADRQEYISFFNYREPMNWVVTYEDTTRQIDVFVESFRQIDLDMYPNCYYSISVIAYSPYFRSIDAFGKDLSKTNKLHGFPLLWLQNEEDKSKELYSVESYILSYATSLYNGGDVPTGFRCRIVFTDTVKNPSIATNGNKIIVEGIFLKDEYIDIISYDYIPFSAIGFKHNIISTIVIKNDRDNIINQVDVTRSNFYQLQRGENEFVFSADDGKDEMQIYPFFYQKYLGV